MKLPNRRFSATTLASLLTLGAIAGPCLSWYLVGTRDVERRATTEYEKALGTAKMTAAQLAERIRTRLELLREAEERRPFYHYQNLYHDPKGASEGASIVLSPLAQSPTDPFLFSYFQISETGNLTVPTLNEEVTTQSDTNKDTQRDIRRALELAEPTIMSLLSQQRAQSSSAPLKFDQLTVAAWEQNLNANRFYANIRSAQAGLPPARELPQSKSPNPASDTVQVQVGSFHWFSVPIRGNPTPIAMREVKTPLGLRIQGFVIAPAAVAELLHGEAQLISTDSDPPLQTGSVPKKIGETGLTVVVDAADALAHTPALYKQMRADFLQFFAGGVAAAIVAGLCVVGLVWQAERLARQRSQFAASAAHELRTPLAGMRMYSEMLTEGLGDPAKSKDYARRISDEVARLGRVVGNVLGFSRLERGALTVRPELGDLAEAATECVGRQRPTLEAAGAKVELAIADALPLVRFDRDAMAEILQNLLDNAEKHTRGASNRTIRVSLTKVDHSVALSVADRGPGVTMELRSRLFRPFERGKNADAPAGLGLGLVLAQGLARAQGGDISYADAPERGAVFTISLPL